MVAAERVTDEEELASPTPTWVAAQESAAREAGLSVLLIAGPQPPQLAESNNNSICKSFQSSPSHAQLCEPFCGEAFARAQAAGEAVYYRCHAGLHCFAMPVQHGSERPSLAVIGGRAFLSSADYRRLVERFRDGDLQSLWSPGLLNNVIFSTPGGLEKLVALLSSEAAKGKPPPPASTATTEEPPPKAETHGAVTAQLHGNSHAIRQSLRESCQHALSILKSEYGVETAALIFRVDEKFVRLGVRGGIDALAAIVCERLNGGAWPELRGREAIHQSPLSLTFQGGQAEVFPLTVGGELRGALVVGRAPLNATVRASVVEFCEAHVLPLEVLRLREELQRQLLAAHHLQSFSAVLNAVEPEEAYSTILRHSVELMRSERGSLMLFDEGANELKVQAAIGPRAEVAQKMHLSLDASLCGAVLNDGRPLVVKNLRAAGHAPAPADRNYKSDSFISYPIIIGGRRIGVLNMTDKLSGEVYDDLDLNLLELIAPQLALALDRASWHQKATQFQLLSITDPLTGLVNRRYMEERLAEEVERTKRHHFEMSFLMLDIDHFKLYNDRQGHQAGDLALEMTAQCLKSALRTEDVASRYGGEEFTVLLPQTSIGEACVIAERIRRRVERTQFVHGETQPHRALTVSIGISAFGAELETPSAIIGAADQALYAAKRRGRNCVDIFGHQPISPPIPHAD